MGCFEAKVRRNTNTENIKNSRWTNKDDGASIYTPLPSPPPQPLNKIPEIKGWCYGKMIAILSKGFDRTEWECLVMENGLSKTCHSLMNKKYFQQNAYSWSVTAMLQTVLRWYIYSSIGIL